MFLAHLIDFYQMCYCCRKLDFHERADARELSLVNTGHMAREQMRERMQERILGSGYYFSTSDWLREIT